jgi:hypothetical protein
MHMPNIRHTNKRIQGLHENQYQSHMELGLFAPYYPFHSPNLARIQKHLALPNGRPGLYLDYRAAGRKVSTKDEANAGAQVSYPT